MNNPFKKKEDQSQTSLDNNEALSLASGESYILFNDLRGKIVVWINCDKDMQIRLTQEELKKSFYSIFPNLNISDLLFYLNRGDYVFTDRLNVRPLRPQDAGRTNPIPTLKDAMQIVRQQQQLRYSKRSPFSIL